MDAAIEAGAEDVVTNDDGSIGSHRPGDYLTVKEALEAAGFTAEFGQVTMKAENETELSGEDGVRDAEAARRAGKPGRRAGGLYQRRHRRINRMAPGRAALRRRFSFNALNSCC